MNEFRITFPKQPTVAYIDSLLKSVRQVRELENSKVTLDLSATTEVSALLVCFLCGLVDLSWERNNSVSLVLPRNKKAQKAIRTIQYISQNPETATVQITENLCQLRSISGYRTSDLDDMLEVIQYNHRALSAGMRNDVRIMLTELLTNAIDHSGERKCYVCVGIWGKSKQLHVAFLDFGVGIPKKLRTRYPELDNDRDAIKALLKLGLTTRTKMEGGRGYKTIQECLERGNGRLHIFSGNAKIVLRYDRGEYAYKHARKEFVGTCIDFQVDPSGQGYFMNFGEMGEEFFL